jgi:hypothetical protein
MNEGEEMKIFNKEMLKSLSADDMERLRREMREMNRRVREELGRRERYCVYCGDRLGTSDYGFRYCSSWHSYLDSHEDTETPYRVDFERKRALRRIRTIKKATELGATSSEHSNPEEAVALQISLRNLRIRQILNEYHIITGESLNTSIRSSRRSKAPDQ